VFFVIEDMYQMKTEKTLIADVAELENGISRAKIIFPEGRENLKKITEYTHILHARLIFVYI
jgi:hypothetical protein